MSGFKAHAIHHLSPSTCNTFVASPAMFVLEKCLKKRGNVGPAAHRGTAVEDGIAHGLLHPEVSIDECIEITNRKFETLTALSTTGNKDKEREGLPGMVRHGLLELRPYGIPTGTQIKVETEIEGLAVPILGYCDFEWDQHGIGTDLKTTHQLASKISINHARQVSLYRHCRGWKSTMVTYCTSKKVASYELENADQHFESLKKICFAIQKFVSVSSDPWELASLVVPDVDSFYFNDPETRQYAFEVWGI